MTEEEAISDLATEFRNWLRVAEIGAALVYFSGNLAAARQQHQKIAEGANTVWREGYLAGLVRLTQRKRSDGPGHDYIATSVPNLKFAISPIHLACQTLCEDDMEVRRWRGDGWQLWFLARQSERSWVHWRRGATQHRRSRCEHG